MIIVTHIDDIRVTSNERPEAVLQSLLNKMEEKGHTILSVNIIRKHNTIADYEAFITTRWFNR